MSSESIIQQFQGPLTSTLEGSRVHYWPAPSGTPKAILMFIPGNPGLADYYLDYLGLLHRQVNDESGGNFEIFCPSQLGHDPLAATMPSSLVSLNQQVEQKGRILETITSRFTAGSRPRIILAGHSIGSWMALEIVRRGLNKLPVYSIHLLFPALHQMSQTPNAKKLLWLLQLNDKASSSLPYMLIGLIIAAVLRIIQIMPLPVVHFLVLIGAPTQPPSAVRTTTNLILSPKCVQQALSMGNEEMNIVQEVEDLPTSASMGPAADVKLRAYWAAGDIDGWAPERTRRVVETTLGMQSYILPQDILDKSGPMPLKATRKHKGYSIDEIRQARRSKRRALAGMVRAASSASYGLASSITQLGYRRNAGPPVVSSRPVRRRSSLMAAKATRRFDGSIYIEPAGDELDDLLSSKDSDGIDGLVLKSPSEELPPGSHGLRMPTRASIVCRHGFKHAFVLENSEQMASISAALILADMTD